MLENQLLTAKDMGTGKDAKITIQSTTKMSDDEIKKMQEDAEGHAEEDKKKKEAVDIKNEAESFIYTTEKLVSQDLKDKIPQEKGIQITDAIKELKDSLTQDTEQIKQKLEALKTNLHLENNNLKNNNLTLMNNNLKNKKLILILNKNQKINQIS